MTHHLLAEHLSADMRECIENCSDCHDVCVETLAHCLRRGGEHVAPDHIGALLDCAQACDTSRDFMLRAPLSTRRCADSAPRRVSGVQSRARRSVRTTT